MTAATAFQLDIPVEQHTLANGLRVVLSRDTSAPVVLVAVYYHVGMRLEPRGRTGFAHLFEHLMFQGSEHLGKMELVQRVQQNGGALNGSTRYDFTNYFEALPKHTLELVLWMEADRMRGPKITDAELNNQRDVVKNEIRVNVLNQPYGGFPWIDMAEQAYANWHNSHNGYGDMVDLDAATLDDAREFFDSYYSPANAVLVVVGDFEPTAALAMSRRYFEGIPAQPRPEPADVTEPAWTAERRFTKDDPLASQPAVAVSYQVPEHGTPEYFAMGLLDQMLLQGDDSALHHELVNKRGMTGDVDGGMNFLGNMYNAQTPLLWTASAIHDPAFDTDAILEAFDAAVEPFRAAPPSPAVFDRAVVKARSAFYDSLTSTAYPGFGRADLLASFALIDGDAAAINEVDARFAAVTPELVHAVARDYLRPDGRAVLSVNPTAGAPNASEDGAGAEEVQS
ncbi:MAG: pitrilysin family protein [Chloroflexi bacterium]|nr:pitrilysin family protein [Chloroflexota bacterium]MDA1145989.1 pitrilysin family protein [Chloroflexota bacterium]